MGRPTGGRRLRGMVMNPMFGLNPPRPTDREPSEGEIAYRVDPTPRAPEPPLFFASRRWFRVAPGLPGLVVGRHGTDRSRKAKKLENRHWGQRRPLCPPWAFR